MASRRMISAAVFSSDKFMDLNPITQLLYLQIGLNADDDGFTNRVNAIRKTVDATKENVNELVDAGFIYIFGSGVAVDMFWNVNNSVRKDRYHPTVYQEEYALLTMDTEGRYVLKPSDNQMDTECQPSDNQMDTEARLGKDSIGYREKQPRARAKQTQFPVVVNENDDALREAVRFYTDHISALYADGISKVKLLLSQYGMAEFKRAVTLMAKRGGRSLNYLEKILQDPHEDTGQLEEATIRAVLK